MVEPERGRVVWSVSRGAPRERNWQSTTLRMKNLLVLVWRLRQGQVPAAPTCRLGSENVGSLGL